MPCLYVQHTLLLCQKSVRSLLRSSQYLIQQHLTMFHACGLPGQISPQGLSESSHYEDSKSVSD